MIVIFTNIPKDSYHDDFRKMIDPVIKGSFFKAGGTINNIEIIALKENDADIDALEFQALVNVEPEAAAMKVINKLHRTNFKGYRIMVRQYFIRNPDNDKRRRESNVDWPQPEKRSNSTRRRDLKAYKIAMPLYQ